MKIIKNQRIKKKFILQTYTYFNDVNLKDYIEITVFCS